MKIGVLTHPLYGNYGGMIQAYALVKVLNSLGHEAYNLTYTPNMCKKHMRNPIKRFKDAYRTKLLEYNCGLFRVKLPLMLQIKTGLAFQQKHVPCLPIEPNLTKKIEEYGIESIVVGSDQVWRMSYVRNVITPGFFFLDFAPQAVRKNSIAYAASYGTDEWEGSAEETDICSGLLKDFKAIAVRESSGVDICRDTMGVNAVRIADPTLLLQSSDYSELIDQEKTWAPESAYLSTYLLDFSPETEASIHSVAKQKNLMVQPLKPNSQSRLKRNRMPMSVQQWLKNIRDSQYLVTDSFHGCVFAIIFNIPFVCLGNEKRGAARFQTLLSIYGLEDRILFNHTEESILQAINTPINWEAVNTIRQEERNKGLQYLRQNLSSQVKTPT